MRRVPVVCSACRGIGTIRVPRTQEEIAERAAALLAAGRRIDSISPTVLRTCGPCSGSGYLREEELSPETVAAIWPETVASPEPVPTPELWGFAKDAIVAAELRRGLAVTSHELAAVLR